MTVSEASGTTEITSTCTARAPTRIGRPRSCTSSRPPEVPAGERDGQKRERDEQHKDHSGSLGSRKAALERGVALIRKFPLK